MGTVSIGVVVAALIASPALAGDVLVPLAANQQTIGITQYSTRIWVSNPTSAPLTFTTRFYAAGSNGLQAPPASSPLTVGAGASLVLVNAAPAGGTGMLGINGAAALGVGARMEASIGGQSVGLTEIPAITAADSFAANTVGQISGLERIASASLSDLYLFNLETKATTCSLKLFQAGGSQLATTATVILQPLQRRDFIDTINGFSIASLTDVRVQATCDKRFWLAGLVRRAAGELAFVGPAATLAASVLGGTGGGTDPPQTGDAVTFSVPGVFLNAVAGNSYKTYNLPAKQGQAYRSAVVEFDLGVRTFPNGLFTGVHSLRRAHPSRSSRILYYGLQIVNANSKTTLDLGEDEVLARGPGPWQEFHAYHLKISYDLIARRVTLEVLEGGIRKQLLAGQALHFDLSNDGHPLSVDFGQNGIADGAYYPPLGWQYSNLKVVLTP